MNPLLELLDRLIAQALAEQVPAAPRGALQVCRVTLDEDGARIVAELRPPAGEGELVLRLRAEPPRGERGERQHLLLTIEQGPQRWAPGLEPFRRVLERARLRLELDFSA